MYRNHLQSAISNIYNKQFDCARAEHSRTDDVILTIWIRIDGTHNEYTGYHFMLQPTSDTNRPHCYYIPCTSIKIPYPIPFKWQPLRSSASDVFCCLRAQIRQHEAPPKEIENMKIISSNVAPKGGEVLSICLL